MKDCVESHHRAGGSRGMGPWAFGIPIVLVSALGLLLNAYVLLVVLGLGKQIQQQTSNTLLLIHLGAVEFALCFVLLVFTTGPWTIPGSWCAVHGFLLTLLHPVALWTVTGLNCDRYYAIAAPLHYTAVVSPRRVILGLVGAWIGAFILCLPPFSGLIAPYKYSQDFGCCIPAFTNETWTIAGVIYTSVYLFVGLVLPAILITACNIRVLGIARYHRHRIASAIYEVTLSAQVTITHQRNPFFIPTVTSPSAGGPPKFHSAASTVMQLVGSVYLLYFPYCGIILWEACTAASHSRLHLHPRFASLASLLLASSPPINGLLYGLKSRTIRRSVQNYWRKKVTKSELQQEIQARTPSVAGSRRPSGSGPVSLFPFPPLQRRLSEALLNLGTNSRAGGGFESGNIGAFNCNRLQPAASCNTLRVPTSESSESNRLVRTSASTASLMGYRDSTSTIRESSLFRDSIDTSKRSPIILITRTHSVEIPDGGGSPVLKRSCIASGNFGTIVTDKRRWRHISTGSDSSTGSSDASSIWTTGIAHRAAKGNLKNSIDNWPIAIRHVPLGILFNGLRASNNSESSDTTDTTATTTTSTLPSKIISLAQETQSINNKNDEKPKVERKNSEEKSESESSWGSIEEKGSNDINEDDNSEKEFVEKNEENFVEERGEGEKVDEKKETEECDENEENEEEEEEEEDEDENSDSGNDNSKQEIDNEVVKKCRKRRKEKMRTQIINDEKKINENNDNIKLRPLLTTLSS
ncbi:uncharacterized protein LOC130665464 [Microplitis mediator]|uniref:uncharacterized protein LOC130665464 n=1 Tax=Microplitis mediator TaxID=375433 RepID=UPI002557A36C|nr:uncharacterized protein LOC130665464 [Microplitis mediator]